MRVRRIADIVCPAAWVAGSVLAFAGGAVALAQNTMPDWQRRAGAAMQFDVASVKENRDDNPPSYSNIPLGPGDVYRPTGGLFRANDRPLIVYIGFAYKLPGSQADLLARQLPEWATTERFDIEARAGGSPTKDQMRLMMQALLADRFHLAVHYEARELPVYVLEVAKPGKLGPELQPHPAGSSCTRPAPADEAGATSASSNGSQHDAGNFPETCGGIVAMTPKFPGCMAMGARNIPIKLFADSIAELGQLDRPVEDQTGLAGTYDFRLDWMPRSNDAAPPDASLPLEDSGPSIFEALSKQMGLKLQAKKGLIEEFVVDHIDHPTAN